MPLDTRAVMKKQSNLLMLASEPLVSDEISIPVKYE